MFENINLHFAIRKVKRKKSSKKTIRSDDTKYNFEMPNASLHKIIWQSEIAQK